LHQVNWTITKLRLINQRTRVATGWYMSRDYCCINVKVPRKRAASIRHGPILWTVVEASALQSEILWMFASESRWKPVLFDSHNHDLNLLLLHSSNGLVHGNTTRSFVPHQSVRKSLNNNKMHLSAIFIVINWSLTADCWPVKVNWGLTLGLYVTGNGAT